MIDHRGIVYSEIKTELSGPIKPSEVYDETR